MMIAIITKKVNIKAYAARFKKKKICVLQINWHQMQNLKRFLQKLRKNNLGCVPWCGHACEPVPWAQLAQWWCPLHDGGAFIVWCCIVLVIRAVFFDASRPLVNNPGPVPDDFGWNCNMTSFKCNSCSIGTPLIAANVDYAHHLTRLSIKAFHIYSEILYISEIYCYKSQKLVT